MVYPFLPVIARGLHVTPGHIAGVIAVRNLGALTSPVSASAAERYGRRRVMSLGVAVVGVACLVVAATDIFLVAAVAMIVVGIARPGLDLATQAWFADRVPYKERGRVYGISELNWSLSLLIVPLAAYLIVLGGWRAPFVLVAAMAAVGAIWIARSIPPDGSETGRGKERLTIDGRLLRVMTCVALFNLAAEVIFVVYGQWLEGSLGLSITGIGAFTLGILVAEFVGAGLVAVISDSFGLKKMWVAGVAASAFMYLLFPLVGGSVLGGLGVVTLWIVSYEVSFVASVPFISEMSQARDKVLSGVFLSVGLGRAVGAALAQPIFATGGIALSGGVAAACAVLALVLLAPVPEHPIGLAADVSPQSP
jgi:predicted MFS family arabinose efflux permease